MVMEKQLLHTCLYKAKQSFKLGNEEEARDFCDLGIAYIADMDGSEWVDQATAELVLLEYNAGVR